MRDAALDAGTIDLDAERDAPVHRHGQRLRSTHPAEPRGENDLALERATEPASGQLRQRLERSLQDALRADVDPRPGGHLAVHREPEPLEPVELVPVRPRG